MVSPQTKKMCQAIVNVFETGSPVGDYSRVTVMQGDPGHLTYGRSQKTLASGNLALLIRAYCQAVGRYADKLTPYIPRLDMCDYTLDTDVSLHTYLRQAGNDQTMRQVQDDFFDRVYWQPALNRAKLIGASLPLSVCTIYDSIIHGSFALIAARTNREKGHCRDVGEKGWIARYLLERQLWLEKHRIPILRKTRYRCDALLNLIVAKNWELLPPLRVHGVLIASYENMTYPEGREFSPSAEGIEDRVLRLRNPIMAGADVRRLQRLLGMSPNQTDEMFGQVTDRMVRAFQRKAGLVVDGRVGRATWSELWRNA